MSPCTALCVFICDFFFFNDTATTEIYTLSLHDALPIATWIRGAVTWTPAAQASATPCMVSPPAQVSVPACAAAARPRTNPDATPAAAPLAQLGQFLADHMSLQRNVDALVGHHLLALLGEHCLQELLHLRLQ